MLANPDLFKMLLYGAGLLLTIAGLYGLNKYLKASALRSHESVSMTLDDLDRMKETGLIEEEELRRIRRKVSERMLEASMPKPAVRAEESLEQALAELTEESPRTASTPKPVQEPEVAPRASVKAGVQEPIAMRADPTPLPAVAQLAPRRAESRILSSPPRVVPSPESEAPSTAKESSGLPLDIEKLRATGAIDDAEYERLKAYFGRRKQ